jgi:hypothetical protein
VNENVSVTGDVVAAFASQTPLMMMLNVISTAAFRLFDIASSPVRGPPVTLVRADASPQTRQLCKGPKREETKKAV